MFTSQVLVLGALVIEMVLLFVLLLPLPARMSGFTTRVLKSLHPYIILAFSLFVLYLFVESSINLYGYQHRVEPGDDHMAKMEYLLVKFRVERNFYMNLFAFILLLLLFRIRQVVSSLSKTKIELENAKRPLVVDDKKNN
eukprot:TRINITY_DN1736_c0_g1_i1.p1 TRINITY_DN1736_c0_g1~~TRINITY_DN1736_c0_g1_i1.p1  ORF type:complete len:140 (-),score=16.64 TRINITY_DN1736_c0_g1_i1:61-480(-)